MKYRYPFTNAIVFALVMRNAEFCKGLLQLVFPDREIGDIRFHEEFLNVEQTMILGIESRKVRFDVLFKDSFAWYDIEMQVQNEHDIPKRSRYAHSIIDGASLAPGQEYNELKPSYVIFLCQFDPLGEGRAEYCFSMREEKTLLPLGDETYTIILNSTASEPDIPKPLAELFRYMNESIVTEGNDLLKRIDASVHSWNTGEGEKAIMTLEQEILIKEAKARKAGLEEGHAKGLEEGHAKGLEEGILTTLTALVRKGLLSENDAAAQAGISAAEFRAKMTASE